MTANTGTTRAADDPRPTLNRRTLLAGAALGVAAGTAARSLVGAAPQSTGAPVSAPAPAPAGVPGATKGVGFALSHEQFPAPMLLDFGAAAERAGFDIVWTSDHIQPWQDNEGHNGQA